MNPMIFGFKNNSAKQSKVSNFKQFVPWTQELDDDMGVSRVHHQNGSNGSWFHKVEYGLLTELILYT